MLLKSNPFIEAFSMFPTFVFPSSLVVGGFLILGDVDSGLLDERDPVDRTIRGNVTPGSASVTNSGVWIISVPYITS